MCMYNLGESRCKNREMFLIPHSAVFVIQNHSHKVIDSWLSFITACHYSCPCHYAHPHTCISFCIHPSHYHMHTIQTHSFLFFLNGIFIKSRLNNVIFLKKTINIFVRTTNPINILTNDFAFSFIPKNFIRKKIIVLSYISKIISLSNRCGVLVALTILNHLKIAQLI